MSKNDETIKLLLETANKLDPHSDILNEAMSKTDLIIDALGLTAFLGIATVAIMKQKKAEAKKKKEEDEKKAEAAHAKYEQQQKEDNELLNKLDLNGEFFEYKGKIEEVSPDLIANLIKEDYKILSTKLKNNSKFKELIKEEYIKRGGEKDEVPHLFNCKVFQEGYSKGIHGNRYYELIIELFEDGDQTLGAPSFMDVIGHRIAWKYNQVFSCDTVFSSGDGDEGCHYFDISE